MPTHQVEWRIYSSINQPSVWEWFIAAILWQSISWTIWTLENKFRLSLNLTIAVSATKTHMKLPSAKWEITWEKWNYRLHCIVQIISLGTELHIFDISPGTTIPGYVILIYKTKFEILAHRSLGSFKCYLATKHTFHVLVSIRKGNYQYSS